MEKKNCCTHSTEGTMKRVLKSLKIEDFGQKLKNFVWHIKKESKQSLDNLIKPAKCK